MYNKDSNAQNAGSPHPTGKGKASNSSIHHSSCHSSDPKSSARFIPLTFRQWQARQQSSRDLAFGVFLLLVYLVYLHQTALLACSTTGLRGIQQICNSDQQRQKWPLLWDVVCNTTTTSIRTTCAADAGASSPDAVKLWLLPAKVHIAPRLEAAVMTLFKVSLQAVATLVGVGLLSGDVMHIIMLPLRLGALLMMCMSLPHLNIKSAARVFTLLRSKVSSNITGGAAARGDDSSIGSTSRFIAWYHPSDYWHHPVIRNGIVMAQRLLPPLVVALSVNSSVICTNWVWLDQEGSAVRQFMKYAFTGWSAAILMLPFNLQLVFSMLEWLVVYSNSVRPKVLYSDSENAAALASYLEPTHLIASFLLVVVLPNVIVWALEQHQKQHYQQQLQHHHQQKVADQPGLSASAHVHFSNPSDPISKGKVPRKKELHPRNKDGSAVAPIPEAAEWAVAAEAAAGPEPDLKGSGSHLTLQPTSTPADQILHLLESILPVDEAAQVVAAATAAASGLAVLAYESRTMALPVSVKVHCDHSSVSSVGPVLTSALHYQLSPFNTAAAPLAITTACFQGCVQLIANVMGLKRQLTRLQEASSGRSSTADLAASLLSAVKQQVAGVAAYTPVDNNTGLAPTDTIDSSTITSLPVRSNDLDIDVAVGDSSTTTRHTAHCGLSSAGGSSSSSDSKLQPAYTLESCTPLCVVAGSADAEISLQVLLPGLQPGSQDQLSGPVRLLVFREGHSQLLVDEEKQAENGFITHQLPAQSPGVLHLALLPPRPPSPQLTETTGLGGSRNNAVVTAQSQSPKPAPLLASAPSMLLPLLVLPEAAAAELQQYYEVLLTADQGGTTAARAWQSVSAVSLDVSYILSACAAAGGQHHLQAQVKQQMPSGVTEVLKHLLIHLASCKMYAVMHFVVATAANVFTNDLPSRAVTHDEKAAAAIRVTATDAAPGGPDSPGCSGRSSKSSGKAKEDTSPPAASGTSTCVSASELLWGFKNPSLEGRYQAAAFSSSGLLDFIIFVYMLGIGFCCYVNKGSEGSHSTQQGSTSTSTFVRLMLSQLVIIAVALSGSVPVMLLRLNVARTVNKLAEQQGQVQKQSQGQVQKQKDDVQGATLYSPAPPSPAAAAAATSSQSLNTLKEQQQGMNSQAYYAEQVTQQLARAARQKQSFHTVWIVSAVLWLALLALSDVLVAPAYMTRLWGERSWGQDLGAIFSVAIKGYMDQVPLSSFIPVIMSLTVMHVLGCLRYGLRPLYWLAVRHVPMLLMPLIVAARQQVTGRLAFCRRQGVEVV